MIVRFKTNIKIFLLLNLIKYNACDENGRYSKRDLQLIKDVATLNAAKFLVFVQNEKSLKFGDITKNFSNDGFYTSIIDLKTLNELLNEINGEKNILRGITILLINGSYNFTNVFTKVSYYYFFCVTNPS